MANGWHVRRPGGARPPMGAPRRPTRRGWSLATNPRRALRTCLVHRSLVPPRFYLDHLLAGRDLLPEDYAHWLAAHRTLPVMAET